MLFGCCMCQLKMLATSCISTCTSSLLALSGMKSKVNGPKDMSVSDLSHSRPVVLDLGALGFQDRSMKGLQMRLPALSVTCFANAAHAYAQSGVNAAHVKRLYCHHNRCLASLADKHTCENRHVRSMPSASKVPASAGSNHSSVLAAATAASLLRRSVCCILPFNFLSAICSQK